MLAPKKCETVSPQCPEGHEDAYRLGWWQGQIEMCDLHDGTPCQVVVMQQEIDRLSAQLKVRVELERQREESLAKAMELCGFGRTLHAPSKEAD